MATSRSQPVHDPRVLRAIAHPVRGRILDEMSASGSLRAADVAERLGIPANQASFHLRQLARYGLVEEDAEAARDRRDRVWRLVAQDGLTVNVRELARVPGGEAALAVWRRGSEAYAHRVVADAYAEAGDEGTARTIAEHVLRLTQPEVRALAAEVNEVMLRWSEKTRGRTDPDARAYSHLAFLGPYPEDPRT